MKMLVLGGTGFIGRRLVNSLLAGEHEVTLATSGNSENPFGKKVVTMRIDRFGRDSLMGAFSGNQYFDVTFDTIGYRSIDVKNSLDALEGKTGKYVYISSAAVYRGRTGTMEENHFDPESFETDGPGTEPTYHEGKRASEAYIAKNARFPWAAARFPNVMGYDDSTGRFQDHVQRLLSSDEFRFHAPEGRRNCVWVEDAGKFLAWLGETDNTGPFNGATPDSMKGSEFVSRMAEELSVKAKIDFNAAETNSRYSASDDFILDISSATVQGFVFHQTSEWLGTETRMARDRGTGSPNSSDYTNDLFP